MKETFVTITGFKHYYGKSIFAVGSLIKCKEPDIPMIVKPIRLQLFSLKGWAYCK